MWRDAVLLLIFPAAMAYAAVSDLLTMTISNRISLLLLAIFLALALITGMPLEKMGWHLLAGLTVFAAGFFCFAMGWMGGGDVKLAAATAVWIGWSHLLDYLFVASLLGGVLTLGLIQARTLPLPAFLARQPWALHLHNTKTGIPYGIALAFAGLLTYPSSPLMSLLGH